MRNQRQQWESHYQSCSPKAPCLCSYSTLSISLCYLLFDLFVFFQIVVKGLPHMVSTQRNSIVRPYPTIRSSAAVTENNWVISAISSLCVFHFLSSLRH